MKVFQGPPLAILTGYDYTSPADTALTVPEAAVDDWTTEWVAADSFRCDIRWAAEENKCSGNYFLDVAATLNPADAEGLRSFTIEITREQNIKLLPGMYRYSIYGVFAAADDHGIGIEGTMTVAKGKHP